MSKKHQLSKEKTYIGKRGFILNKSLHSEEEISEIKNELNFTPYTSMEYGTVEEPFSPGELAIGSQKVCNIWSTQKKSSEKP